MIRLEDHHIPQWKQLLQQFPDAHILQTLQWAEAKKQNGWSPYSTGRAVTHNPLKGSR